MRRWGVACPACCAALRALCALWFRWCRVSGDAASPQATCNGGEECDGNDQRDTTVRTAAEMRALGRGLASRLRAGDLVVLTGPLGAGKTTLTQGIGDGLGVRGPVTSPTFVIARVHPPLGRGPALVHVDAYRLGDAAEVDDLDLDADLDQRGDRGGVG